jgi:hypothetical protein
MFKKVLLAFLISFFVSNMAMALTPPVPSENFLTLEGPDSVAPGSTIVVYVHLLAKDSINAFDLEITYPKDKLEFLNFDNSASIVDIWQDSPKKLAEGQLKLSGGIIKGFTGTGTLIKLSFKTTETGEANIKFRETSLYLADGTGTEVKARGDLLSLAIKEEARVVSEASQPFEPTPADISIAEELKNYEREVKSDKFLPVGIILALVIAGVCLWAVYNKRKHKP